MEHKHTNLEQSKELQALGLDPLSADLHLLKGNTDGYVVQFGINPIRVNLFGFRNGYIVPCWSMGRLVEMIYDIDRENFEIHVDGIEKQMVISWLDADDMITCEYKINYKNLFTAVYEVTKWILNNKKHWLPTIKTETV